MAVVARFVVLGLLVLANVSFGEASEAEGVVVSLPMDQRSDPSCHDGKVLESVGGIATLTAKVHPQVDTAKLSESQASKLTNEILRHLRDPQRAVGVYNELVALSPRLYQPYEKGYLIEYGAAPKKESGQVDDVLVFFPRDAGFPTPRG